MNYLSQKKEKPERTIDAIRNKYGVSKINLAVLLKSIKKQE